MSLWLTENFKKEDRTVTNESIYSIHMKGKFKTLSASSSNFMNYIFVIHAVADTT